jgi:hypothetical protein
VISCYTPWISRCYSQQDARQALAAWPLGPASAAADRLQGLLVVTAPRDHTASSGKPQQQDVLLTLLLDAAPCRMV